MSVVDVKIKESEDDKLHALSLSHPSLPQSASVSLSASHSPQHAATEALYSRVSYLCYIMPHTTCVDRYSFSSNRSPIHHRLDAMPLLSNTPSPSLLSAL